MLFSALLLQALAATAALAIPTSRERHAQRVARRAAGERMSHPVQIVPRPSSVVSSTNVTQTEYSTNWAGAILVAGANTYKSVTGTFVVPTPREPSGASGSHSASAWVGIDGDTCQTAILQTGVDFTINNGVASYDAWWEWFPDGAHDFDGFVIRAGDTITATVTATSTTSGTASITNWSTGLEVVAELGYPYALCEENAEWIVEDYSVNGGLVPFANFGTVTFTDASATTGSGTVGPAGAQIIDIVANGAVITSASAGSSSVTVSYTGP
ncbi:putative aspergillopepsin [Cubamyces sp. BRFM 1775]|nr:putative aspergillopepsin [Cubamyces sp. BRFM 1775]